MKPRTRKGTLVLGFAALLLLAPLPANAGLADVLSLLVSITGTLRNAVGQALASLELAERDARSFEQQTLWPVVLINQAKTSVAQIRAQYSTLAGQIHSIAVSSATLASPSRLESLLRTGSAGNLSQIDSSYRQVFLAVPAAGDMTPEQRRLVDVDAAFSLGAMKAANLSDQEVETSLAFADGLEQAAASSAPGSAVFLSAQAQLATLVNQAMLQKVLAAELRQEATALSQRSALRKQSAAANKELRNNLLRILSRH
jgi:hypothetical protein